MTSSVKIIFTNTHNVQQQIISYKFHHLPKIQCRPFMGENIYFVEDTFLQNNLMTLQIMGKNLQNIISRIDQCMLLNCMLQY